MAVFGSLIDEINKCSTSFTDTSVASCSAMIDVATSYAKKKDDFLASLYALPTKAIVEQASKITKMNEEKAKTQQTGQTCKQDVDSMKTVDDLCSVIVNLISNARIATMDTGASMRSSAIMNALEEFDWNKCKIGKI